MADIHLHVGLAKTGTTTIQTALQSHAAQLAASGVLVPGGSHRAQRLAAYDLLGQRVSGDDKDVVAGSFRRLADEMAAHTGPAVIVSEEELSLARPRHARRVVRRLSGHRVFLVVSVRDLARTLVSAWQQAVVTGSHTTLPDFVASVRDDPGAADGFTFWVRHDALRVIGTWSSVVPLERIRVLTVPPPGADSRVLLQRFARATGLPDGLWDTQEVRPRNVSFGAAELEVIRRLNATVSDELTLEQHRFLIEGGVRPRLRERSTPPPRLPPEHLPWTRDYGKHLAAELERRGVEVIGDLSDLVPDPRQEHPEPPSEAELLEAADAVLASLAIAHGRLFRRYRRAFFEREGRWPSAAEVVGSQARATGVRLQKSLLRRADTNRLVGRAARAYLRRTSPSRRPEP